MVREDTAVSIAISHFSCVIVPRLPLWYLLGSSSVVSYHHTSLSSITYIHAGRQPASQLPLSLGACLIWNRRASLGPMTSCMANESPIFFWGGKINCLLGMDGYAAERYIYIALSWGVVMLTYNLVLSCEPSPPFPPPGYNIAVNPSDHSLSPPTSVLLPLVDSNSHQKLKPDPLEQTVQHLASGVACAVTHAIDKNPH